MNFLLSSFTVFLSLVLAQTASAVFVPADPTEGEPVLPDIDVLPPTQTVIYSLVVYSCLLSPAEAISLSPQIAGSLVATEVPQRRYF
jgi:hypothetical protein